MRRRRSRVRWVLKWAGTVACGLIVLTAASTLKWTRIVWFNDDGGGMGLFPLELYLSWEDTPWALVSNSWSFYYAWEMDGWSELLQRVSEAPWMPTFESDARGAGLSIPMWIPFAVVASPTVVLWRLDRRQNKHGCCPKCRYDLTGNVSGRCPECGAAVAARAPTEACE